MKALVLSLIFLASSSVLAADKASQAVSTTLKNVLNIVALKSTDARNTQMCALVKNVLAIACGIIEGKGLGENAKAALITRGLTEMGRLCVAKGGKLETLLGLSGMGDLMLTCSSPTSRNMSFGMALGKGISPAKQKNLTEGVTSAESVVMLARKLGISMPICEAVYEILYKQADINVTIQKLLQRPLTQE